MESVDWIPLAQARDPWLAFVNMVMNCGEFLD
jgi:hypothetical protein